MYLVSSDRVVHNHTGANFITMLVTRARANSSKNHTLLMCRIWKMGRNLFSSLDIRDNFKVAFLEKNSNNPKIYLVTITVWGTGSVINWVNLSCWLPDLKVDIWQNLPKKCHFQIISHVQWWTIFFPFLHSAYQECMNFAKIGDGPCYYHWNEICAGVASFGAFVPQGHHHSV